MRWTNLIVDVEVGVVGVEAVEQEGREAFVQEGLWSADEHPDHHHHHLPRHLQGDLVCSGEKGR